MIMKQVQATEAKAHLAELLSRVERGESISITRHGNIIAHLVPAESQDQKLRQKLIQTFRQKRNAWGDCELSTAEIFDLRHDGHRF